MHVREVARFQTMYSEDSTSVTHLESAQKLLVVAAREGLP
jgi:hypothetical protein